MTTNPETLRKRSYKSKERPEQREAWLSRERERKRQKRAEETSEQRETRLSSIREQRKEKIIKEKTEECETRVNRENERKREFRARSKQNLQINSNIQKHNETGARNQEINQGDNDNSSLHAASSSASNICEDEHRILQNFHEKMDKIWYDFCLICIIIEACQRKVPALLYRKITDK